MSTSIERAPGWWILRACSRNPLVRAIDRLELVIIALALVAVLVAASCAGALGTAVFDARSHVYIAQAQTRHTVTGTLPTTWVDRDGNPVGAPAPTSRAGVEAVGVALAAWQTVTILVAGWAWWTHSHLDRRRDAGWERDIESLIDDDGGRTNRQPGQ
jgi:hypothetical protein